MKHNIAIARVLLLNVLKYVGGCPGAIGVNESDKKSDNDRQAFDLPALSLERQADQSGDECNSPPTDSKILPMIFSTSLFEFS
ncbi:MAG: hypothetical protein ACLP29_04525 [Dissulfurispiraceae bacterium]